MNVYRSGSDVSLVIPLVDENGNTLTPSAVSYRVLNQTEDELQAATPVVGFTAGDTSVSVTIPAALNTLTATDIRQLRIITLATQEPGNSEAYIRVSYIVSNEFTLVTGINSYQTFGEATLLTLDMPDMIGWQFAADDRKREAALIEAYHRIGRLRFVVDGVDVVRINEMADADFALLSPIFRDALKKAQVSEADIILGGDPIQRKREEGLLSDSVGESSIMFRPGKPLLMSVSRRSLNYLAGYVTYNNALGRR